MSAALSDFLSSVRTYAELRRGVETILLSGQHRIEEAKVRTYWETGRLIHEHLRGHMRRSGYGAQLVPRLETDLGVNQTVLYRCIRFALAFPNLAARPELSWAHYRLLIQIEDVAERKTLAAQATKRGWTSRELEERVRTAVAHVALELEKAKPPAPREAPAAGEGDGPAAVERMVRVRPPLLVPKRGKVGIHRLVSHGDRLAVDLGFTSFRDLAPVEAIRRQIGDLIRLDSHCRVQAASGVRPADLYTYLATVLRVIDGDTLWLDVALGGAQWLKEKVRLRGLDCAEADTPEGKTARRFVEAEVSRAERVIVTTTKPDKYDRYLCDVFLEHGEGAAAETIFLNNALLQNGHADRKEVYVPADWEQDGEGVPRG